MNLEDQINVKAIIRTIQNLKIKRPKIIENEKVKQPLILKNVSILQLVYDKNSYKINRYYLSLNNNFEIVLDANYKFHAFNIFKNNICYSHDQLGNLIHTYNIKEKAETNNILITKSNGDIYYHPNKIVNNSQNLNQIRKNWGKQLLCYSNKLDRRLCFYVRINKNIYWDIDSIWIG
jgi:hypothetical protein